MFVLELILKHALKPSLSAIGFSLTCITVNIGHKIYLQNIAGALIHFKFDLTRRYFEKQVRTGSYHLITFSKYFTPGASLRWALY